MTKIQRTQLEAALPEILHPDIFLKLGQHTRRETPILARFILGFGSFMCGVIGYYSEGALRLFAIEWTVMFLFLLALELFFRPVFDGISEYLAGGPKKETP